jgi:hypothetical protein
MAVAQQRWDDTVAESDKAFDRWEAAREGTQQWDDRKREALAVANLRQRECNAAITACTTMSQARRAVARLDDPAELDRRLAVAREHDEHWRGGA